MLNTYHLVMEEAFLTLTPLLQGANLSLIRGGLNMAIFCQNSYVPSIKMYSLFITHSTGP